MSPRKAMTALGALALASTVLLSAPAIAQSDDGDDALWLAGWGAAGAAVLTLILTTRGHDEQQNPVSP